MTEDVWTSALFGPIMIEWFGGEHHIIDILIAASGLALFLLIPQITETNGSERYFIPAFGCWLGFNVLIGVEQGTLLSFPRPAGMLTAALLLIGFIGFMARGFHTVWKTRRGVNSSS